MGAKKSVEKPLTLSQLVEFFERAIEPRFRALETRMGKMDERFDEIDERFDDLYKKFEDLRQEYLITNAQMKRIEEQMVTKAEFQTALAALHVKVQLIEERTIALEQCIAS